VPEDGVVEDRAEVGEPDIDAVMPDELGEPIALERDPDEAVDRIGEDRAEDDYDRGYEQIGSRAAANPFPVERGLPRPLDDGLGSGSQHGGLPTQGFTAG
jgi:hypothetical protein